MVFCNVLSCWGASSLVCFFCGILNSLGWWFTDLKKLKLHRLWRTALWLSQNCCLVLHTNFISCRVSFVLRCFYKSTLVVCAVARTVSRFVQLSFDLHGSFGFIQISPSTPSTRSKIQKKYFGFTHAHLKFISAPRKDKHFLGQLWQLMTASNVGAWTHAWQAKWAVFKIEMFVCKRFLPFFLTPSPLFYLRNFSHGLWLLFLVLRS